VSAKKEKAEKRRQEGAGLDSKIESLVAVAAEFRKMPINNASRAKE